MSEFMQPQAISVDEVRSELDDLYAGELLTSMVEAGVGDSARGEPMAAINLGGTILRVLVATGECDAEHAELELSMRVSNSAISTEDGVDGAWSITTATETDRIAVSLVHNDGRWLIVRFSLLKRV